MTAISVVRGVAGASDGLEDGDKGTAWLVTWTLTVRALSSPVTPAERYTDVYVHIIGVQYCMYCTYVHSSAST